MTNSTPLKAIRLKCLDCCCGNSNEVRLCPSEDCPLHGYRFGCRPKTLEKRMKNGKTPSGRKAARPRPGDDEEGAAGVLAARP